MLGDIDELVRAQRIQLKHTARVRTSNMARTWGMKQKRHGEGVCAGGTEGMGSRDASRLGRADKLLYGVRSY